MNQIKLSFKDLKKEVSSSSAIDRFSRRAFTRKMPKGIIPCDYDKEERLMEVEFSDGHRSWCSIKEFFGVVIAEAEHVLLLDTDGRTEHLNIVGIESEKVKRTIYSRLIFERDLPF